MKRITLLLLFVASSVSAQTWNLSFGANTTNYIFTNSQGVNPTFMKPSAGLNMTLGYEKSMSRPFQYDLGLAYSQYKAVGDVQNIPFSYQTDFMGLSGGIGPKLKLLLMLSVQFK